MAVKVKMKGECFKLLVQMAPERRPISVLSLDSRLQHAAPLELATGCEVAEYLGQLVVVFMGEGATVGLSPDEEPSPNEESAVNTSSYEQTSSDSSTSSGSFRTGGAGEQQPTLFDTNDCLRQLWLLTQKNFILTRRNKLWTFFELVVPIAFALPFTLYTVWAVRAENEGHHVSRSRRILERWEVPVWNKTVRMEESQLPRSFHAIPFHLDGRDLHRLKRTTSPESCFRDKTHIAYFARENQGSVDNFINELSKQLSSSEFSVKWVRMEEEDQILQHLRKDAENFTGPSCSHKLDSINQQFISFSQINPIIRFMGGVVFRKFDTDSANLDYDILIPTYYGREDDIWHLNEEWHDPFEDPIDDRDVPEKPPYLATGFLPLQMGIDNLFIRSLKPNATVGSEKIRLMRIPEKEILTPASALLYRYPHLYMFCAFVLVIYTAREISSERSTVKDFLSVMGLSTLVFYISHVLYGSLKILLVFFVCTFPLIFGLGAVSLSVFFVTFILYGVSAVVFAALISSLSKKPNNVIRGSFLFPKSN